MLFHKGLTEPEQSTKMSLTSLVIRKELNMSQVTARLSDDMISALDQAAQSQNRSRAEIIRMAVENYLEDYDDLSLAMARLLDPTDEVMDWQEAKRALLAEN